MLKQNENVVGESVRKLEMGTESLMIAVGESMGKQALEQCRNQADGAPRCCSIKNSTDG